MDCPRGWTAVAIIIYLSLQDTAVFCRNLEIGEPPGNVVREIRECSKLQGNPTSTELYTSILNAAASNGVLSDLLPMLQGQPIVDISRYSQDLLTKPLSVLPMTSSGCVNSQEPIVISNQSIKQPATNQNYLIATSLPCGASYPTNTIPAVSQTISSPALPLSNCVPQIAQAVPLENYSVYAQNAGTVTALPIMLQPQCQFNELNPYNVYNQVFEPIQLSEVNAQPTNLPIIPPSQVLPVVNTYSGPQEISSNMGSLCLPQPNIYTNDGQQLPLNLQINVPTPTAPAPKITVVSASPTNIPIPWDCGAGPIGADFSTNLPQFQYPPQPPIVVGGSSKSSWRNLLPIALVALLSDHGCSKGGGCCCCCSCNGGNSGNTIPIPYPIPIPVNNPIINNCPYPYSSRNRESRDDGDDDDYGNRK